MERRSALGKAPSVYIPLGDVLRLQVNFLKLLLNLLDLILHGSLIHHLLLLNFVMALIEFKRHAVIADGQVDLSD